MPGKSDPQIDLLIELLDQAFDKHAWHGTNLRGSIRGLTVKQLLWRPSPKRHNIWEIALHTAYWKYAINRRFTGGKKGAFPRLPSDWPSLPDKTDIRNWKEDLALLLGYHKTLRKTIGELPESKLNRELPESKYSYVATIYGIASHDLYHAGQIQLLKKMQRG
ncbi:MAG: DinB family protein [candidate division Zixibacteria bacterium]